MPSNPISVTISSAGTGFQVALDWMRGNMALVSIRAASTTGAAPSGGGILQYTLDDLVTTPSASVLWNSASSLPYTSSGAGLVISTSNQIDVPYNIVFNPPPAGLRFNCSAFSTTSLVMKILQGDNA